MALMLRKLSLVVLVLIAVLYPVLRSNRSAEPSELDRRLERLSMLREHQEEAGGRWAALTERDSGAIPAARAGRPGRPRVELRGFPAGASAPVAERIVNDLWTRLGHVDSAVRVTLLIYNVDRYIRERVRSYSGASISIESGGATCVALLPGGLAKDGTVKTAADWPQQVLAPCVLLAGFGLPGPTLQRWLGNTRYAAAGSSLWLSRSKNFIEGEGAMPWMADYRYGTSWQFSGTPQDISDITRAALEMLRPPYQLGAYGLRCTAGDFAACRVGVLDSKAILEATRGLPPDLTFFWSLLDRPTGWTFGTPLPPGASWLSDLIRDQGREKFAKFWKSPAPLDQAFQHAFGEDVGAWSHRWSVRQWENSWDEKYRQSPRMLGASLEPSWTLLVLGWTGVTLLLTAWVARRRQVT